MIRGEFFFSFEDNSIDKSKILFLHIIKIKIKLRIKASLRRKNAFPLQKYITNNNNNNRMEEHCAPIETSVVLYI